MLNEYKYRKKELLEYDCNWKSVSTGGFRRCAPGQVGVYIPSYCWPRWHNDALLFILLLCSGAPSSPLVTISSQVIKSKPADYMCCLMQSL